MNTVLLSAALSRRSALRRRLVLSRFVLSFSCACALLLLNGNRDFQQGRICYVITVYLRRNEDRISTVDRICTLRLAVFATSLRSC